MVLEARVSWRSKRSQNLEKIEGLQHVFTIKYYCHSIMSFVFDPVAARFRPQVGKPSALGPQGFTLVHQEYNQDIILLLIKD